MRGMKRWGCAVLLLPVLCLFGAFAPAGNDALPSLVPYPAALELKEGFFVLSRQTRLTTDRANAAGEAVSYLRQLIQSLPDGGAEAIANVVEIDTDSGNPHPEGYTMEITPERIRISSPHSGGLFYAVQTLKQLVFQAGLHRQSAGGPRITCMSVADYPAYPWRGFMLDVSRHFFSLEYLKKQVDLIASYKMKPPRDRVIPVASGVFPPRFPSSQTVGKGPVCPPFPPKVFRICFLRAAPYFLS